MVSLGFTSESNKDRAMNTPLSLDYIFATRIRYYSTSWNTDYYLLKRYRKHFMRRSYFK